MDFSAHKARFLVLRALKRTQNRTSFWHQNYESQFAVRSYALCKELRIYRLIEVQTSPLIAHRTHLVTDPVTSAAGLESWAPALT